MRLAVATIWACGIASADARRPMRAPSGRGNDADSRPVPIPPEHISGLNKIVGSDPLVKLSAVRSDDAGLSRMWRHLVTDDVVMSSSAPHAHAFVCAPRADRRRRAAWCGTTV